MMHRPDRSLIPDRCHLAARFGDTAHHFGGVDGCVIFTAWVHTFRGECKEPILAYFEIMLNAKFWQKQFTSGPGIGSRF